MRGTKLRGKAFLSSVLVLFAYAIYIAGHTGGEKCLLNAQETSLLERRFVSAPAPRANTDISIENPVILFHQRKAGGQTLRRSLHMAARRLGLSYYIPCHPPVPCENYSIKGNKKAVYGGHFSVSEVKYVLRNGPPKGVTCLTNFREPVSRVESCFYFRFNRTEGGDFSCMNNIPVETLRDILVNRVDRYGDGCLDEPFRILSGITDERLLRKSNDVKSPEFWAAYQNSLRWLEQCHILILDDDRTARLVGKYIPQLKANLNGLEQKNRNKNEKCQLDKARLSLLHELTAAERRLYKAVQSRVNYLVEISEGT